MIAEPADLYSYMGSFISFTVKVTYLDGSNSIDFLAAIKGVETFERFVLP